MTDTAEKIEQALQLAARLDTPVIVSSLTLQQAVDEIRAARPKGRVNVSAWESGYAQGKAAEKRANALGEQALTSKIAGALETLATWEHHGSDEDRDSAAADVYDRCARELRVALDLGDVTIACPCGAS